MPIPDKNSGLTTHATSSGSLNPYGGDTEFSKVAIGVRPPQYPSMTHYAADKAL